MFGNKMLFLLVPWRFLISNKLEQLYFKLEKILGLRNMQEKLEKYICYLDKKTGHSFTTPLSSLKLRKSF